MKRGYKGRFFVVARRGVYVGVSYLLMGGFFCFLCFWLYCVFLCVRVGVVVYGMEEGREEAYL